MIYEKIPLDNNDENVYLEVYAPDTLPGFLRDALLVIPGGGYGCVCYDREGEPVALDFVGKGTAAFVLHYSVGEKALFPRPLIEASKAMKYIKDNAKKYMIDPERVFAAGFSAGGHLCTALGTLWHLKEIYSEVPMEEGYNKPLGIIPVYPVISLNVPTHMGSFSNILGKSEFSEEDKHKWSLEEYVDGKSSPACIIHTSDDATVPVFNALALANAYAKAGRQFELHIFKSAPHGMALANEITECGNAKYNNPSNAKWTLLAREWMKNV